MGVLSERQLLTNSIQLFILGAISRAFAGIAQLVERLIRNQ